MAKNYITTAVGLEKAKKDLHQMKSIERPKLSERIATAKELGDLSENAEYHDAKDAMAFLEGRIIELENFVVHAQVSDPASTDVITVGCTVKCELAGKPKTFDVVGSNESDPGAGRISNESPLGRALMGKKKGDVFEANFPSGKKNLKVLEITC